MKRGTYLAPGLTVLRRSFCFCRTLPDTLQNWACVCVPCHSRNCLSLSLSVGGIFDVADTALTCTDGNHSASIARSLRFSIHSLHLKISVSLDSLSHTPALCRQPRHTIASFSRACSPLQTAAASGASGGDVCFASVVRLASTRD